MRMERVVAWCTVTALVGAVAGFAAGTVSVVDSETKMRTAARVAPARACSRLCFAFEPSEVVDGGVRGVAVLGLGVGREVRVRVEGAKGEPAQRLAREWTRTDEIELCLDPHSKTDGFELIGELCTRDSCLSRELHNDEGN